MGKLGDDQLKWLKSDLAHRSLLDAHRDLRAYSRCGWSIRSGAGARRTQPKALTYLKRFGSVTVLNGHIHQVVQKVEGNVAFHTATSTAFPQPAPGAAPNPGPMTVPAGQLRSVLGVTNVKVIRGHSHLAVVDSTLAETT
jgi:Icc protein